MAHNDARRRRRAFHQVPAPRPAAVMDLEARRHACVAFRVKLSRDTGVNLPASDCEALLDETFVSAGGEQVSLQSNPGLFYAGLGAAISQQTLPLVPPDHAKVAAWCWHEAAEVHMHPVGMRALAGCLYAGLGVVEDPVRAAALFQEAADLGDAAAKVALGGFLLNGVARAGIAQDAVRGFALLREAVEQGCGPLALYQVAQCYLKGEGVEKDAVYGVSLLRQVIEQGYKAQVDAQVALAMCYQTGEGVETDTVMAAAWCQRAAQAGDAVDIENLAIIRKCDFCGSTPARKLCVRCRKTRYCGPACIQGHWNRATDPHKGNCRRAADGGASTSTGGA